MKTCLDRPLNELYFRLAAALMTDFFTKKGLDPTPNGIGKALGQKLLITEPNYEREHAIMQSFSDFILGELEANREERLSHFNDS